MFFLCRQAEEATHPLPPRGRAVFNRNQHVTQQATDRGHNAHRHQRTEHRADEPGRQVAVAHEIANHGHDQHQRKRATEPGLALDAAQVTEQPHDPDDVDRQQDAHHRMRQRAREGWQAETQHRIDQRYNDQHQHQQHAQAIGQGLRDVWRHIDKPFAGGNRVQGDVDGEAHQEERG